MTFYDVWLSPTEDEDDSILHVVLAQSVEDACSIVIEAGGSLRLVACMESPPHPLPKDRSTT